MSTCSLCYGSTSPKWLKKFLVTKMVEQRSLCSACCSWSVNGQSRAVVGLDTAKSEAPSMGLPCSPCLLSSDSLFRYSMLDAATQIPAQIVSVVMSIKARNPIDRPCGCGGRVTIIQTTIKSNGQVISQCTYGKTIQAVIAM